LGPQISFVRSLTIDSWNRKQLASMEFGGNTKALDFIRKNGLQPTEQTPIDYKGAMQRYKADLAKQVDNQFKSQAQVEFKPFPVAEKPAPVVEKSAPVEEQKAASKISQAPVISAPITFESKNKIVTTTTGAGGKAGQVKAKKIDDIDFSALSLDDNNFGSPEVKKKEKQKDIMEEGAFRGEPMESKPSTVYVKTNTNTAADHESYKKYENSKAISSDHFFNKEENEKFDRKKFSNSKGISSAQYYGEEEESPPNASEGLMNFLSNAKERLTDLKDKAKDYVQAWQNGVEG